VGMCAKYAVSTHSVGYAGVSSDWSARHREVSYPPKRRRAKMKACGVDSCGNSGPRVAWE
jgi:hypothetical protein